MISLLLRVHQLIATLVCLVLLVTVAARAAETSPCVEGVDGQKQCVSTPCHSIGGRLAWLLILLGAGTGGAGYVFYQTAFSAGAAQSEAEFARQTSPPNAEAHEMGTAPTDRNTANTTTTSFPHTTQYYDYVRPGVDY